MATCPEGHDAPVGDYCDVCGLLAPPPAPLGSTCPDCAEPASGPFCEGCGHDFTSRSAGRPSPGSGDGPRWTVLATADRTYFDAIHHPEDGIPFPPCAPPRQFALAGVRVRIGRRPGPAGAAAEIDLAGPPQDPGISRVHAILLGGPGDSWSLTDPGSTNGTRLNGGREPIAVNVGVPLHDGDRVHLGVWTTLTLRRNP